MFLPPMEKQLELASPEANGTEPVKSPTLPKGHSASRVCKYCNSELRYSSSTDMI